jgi:hypothetical protein
MLFAYRLFASATVRNELQLGTKMKIAVGILFVVGLFALPSGQARPSANQAVAPSVGLETGQQAPAFVLSDQFGHEQSNETLKGSNGTVLLFFRSADW